MGAPSRRVRLGRAVILPLITAAVFLGAGAFSWYAIGLGPEAVVFSVTGVVLAVVAWLVR